MDQNTTKNQLFLPDQLLGRVLDFFKPAYRKSAFLTAFIGGLLCHMYILTNMLPEHDWQYNFYISQNKLMLGRWLLKLACAPSGKAILPWIIGLLVLLYLSLTAVVVAELLKIKSPTLAGLCGLTVVCVPCVASGFAYMFTADGYFLSVLLAACAAKLGSADKKPVFNGILGAICLGCSMGIYQAYAGFTLALFCAVLILRALEVNSTFKSLLMSIRGMAITAIGGAGVYFAVLKFLLLKNHTRLDDYQGISALSGGSDFSLGGLLNRAYLVFCAWREGLKYALFEFPTLGKLDWCTRALYCGIVLLFVLLILNAFYSKLWKRPVSLLAVCCGLGAMPLTFNFVEIVTSDVSYHLLMRYSICVPFLFAIALLQNLIDNDDAHVVVKNVASVTGPLIMLWVCLCWAVLVNMGYTNMQYQYERVYSTMVRVADRIQRTEGYHDGISVRISCPSFQLENNEPLFDVHGLTGLGGISQYDSYHYISFLNTWCGLNIDSSEGEFNKNLWKNQEFQAMPEWPAEGCTKVIEGVLVVKTPEE